MYIDFPVVEHISTKSQGWTADEISHMAVLYIQYGHFGYCNVNRTYI